MATPATPEQMRTKTHSCDHAQVSTRLLAIWCKRLRHQKREFRKCPPFWFLRQGNFTLCHLGDPTIGPVFYGMAKRNPVLDPEELPFRGQEAAFGRAAKVYVDWLVLREGELLGSKVPIQVHQQADQQPDAVTQARLRQIDLRTAGPADMYPQPAPEEFR